MRDFVHELLQIIDGHVLKVDLLSAVDIGGIGQNANRHPRPGDIWESARGSAPVRSRKRRAYLTVPEKRLSLWGS